jgi:hypothetical protein
MPKIVDRQLPKNTNDQNPSRARLICPTACYDSTMYRLSVRILGPIACACIIALLFSGLLHSLIPHHHSGAADNHGDDQDSAIWTSLHSAIQHEQKKSLAVVDALMFSIIWVISVVIAETATRVVPAEIVACDPCAGAILRRGILPHRTFR